MNKELTGATPADHSPKTPIEVGLGLVLRPTLNISQTFPPVITTPPHTKAPPYDILITLRPPGTIYGGYWEFPGGKVLKKESIEDCIRRELAEELGIRIHTFTSLTSRTHTYPHGTVRLHPWLCRLAADSPPPRAIEVADWMWCRLCELDRYRFPEANAAVMQDVLVTLEHASIDWGDGAV